MSKKIRIKKGKDIRLVGAAENKLAAYSHPDVVAVKPTDFVGLTPRLILKDGAEVKAGTPIFHDKFNEKIVFASPVSGEIAEVVRGAKRRILEIRILADKENRSEEFGPLDLNSLNREQIIDRLMQAGVWPMIRQRPFSTIADPHDLPRDIHVSCFDNSPLAPDMDFIVEGNEKEFQAGIDVLNKLCDNKVNLNLPDKGGETFGSVQNAEINRFSGPHPSSNVGVQIHHLKPINKGEVIWYTYPQEVIIIGRLALTGKYDARRKITLTGSMVKGEARQYHEVIGGTSIKGILSDALEPGDKRVISGNVLTGTQVDSEGFLGFFSSQITVIPEGNKHKFLLTEGWLSPGLNRFSLSRAYPSWLMGKKKYDLDTNLNGEIRSFVMTGQLEKVFPFDIYPMQLIKAIMINDIDNMEKMGIYEVDAEDFALAEVACTSKIDIQKVVREGMENLRAELS
ncbi:MAG: Na(+)-translocating NADH-quinone reductase subunit A [Flavobacteriales bacterium]|nr:Na(+)-translocating NADH-quinone reductase subunit A [Flavobacteriales bacterium]NNK81216.1 Na(+)-translocating NADH-quinone reductase subunit A [Flavobacteriales bacterium]